MYFGPKYKHEKFFRKQLLKINPNKKNLKSYLNFLQITDIVPKIGLTVKSLLVYQ